MSLRDDNRSRSIKDIMITFLCVNSGNWTSENDIILQAAWKAGTDIMLLQEPWIFRKDNDWLSKSHQSYKKFVSVSSGGDWMGPRSLIHLRKRRSCRQNFLCGSCQDFVTAEVDVENFASIYRAPGTDWDHFFSWTPTGLIVNGGEFNAVHSEWQPLINNHHRYGHRILEKMRDNGIGLFSRPGELKNSRGTSLDLVWFNYEVIASVALELDSTSDHRTLAGDIPKTNQRGVAAFKLSRPYQKKLPCF